MLNINNFKDLEFAYDDYCESSEIEHPQSKINFTQKQFEKSLLNLPEPAFNYCLDRCHALRLLYDQSQTVQLSHWQGFSLIWFSMNFQIFPTVIDKMKGWGESNSDKKQILNSVEKKYSPMSCIEMINRGLCDKNKPCFLFGGELLGKYFRANPILFVNGYLNENKVSNGVRHDHQ